MFEDDDDRVYRVVRNDQEQYSIWPADRTPPPGWHDRDFGGTKAECLAHIDRVWTDLRPRAARRDEPVRP